MIASNVDGVIADSLVPEEIGPKPPLEQWHAVGAGRSNRAANMVDFLVASGSMEVVLPRNTLALMRVCINLSDAMRALTGLMPVLSSTS